MAMNTQKRNRLLAGANALVVVIAAFAITVMLNILSVRHYRKVEWKAGGSVGLSELTIKQLQGLKQPVTVTAVLADQDASPELKEQIVNLLDRYKGYSDKLTVKYLDPDRNPAEIQRLQVTNLHTLVFEATVDGRPVRQVVNATTLAEMDEGDGMFGPPTMKSFKGEEAFTNAIAALGEAPRAVCFTSGHGEQPLEGGIGALKQMIEGENYSVRELAPGAPIPAECAVVAVAGLQAAFQPAEAAQFEAHLAAGGRLLLMLDPVVDRARTGFAPTGLEPLFESRGAQLHRNLVFDPAAQVQTNAQEPIFYTAVAGGHAITRPFAGGDRPQILVPVSRSFGLPDASAAGAAPGGAQWIPLMKSSAQSFGLTNLAALQAGRVEPGPGDLGGPLVLGAAWGDEANAAGGRLVAFGNARFASDLFQTTRNPDLVINAIHWLAQRESRIAIPPRAVENANLTITRREAWLCALWLVLIAPALVAGAGAWNYIARRRG